MDRLREIGSDRSEELLAGLRGRRVVSFRTNTLRTDPVVLRSSLEAEGLDVTPVPWYEHAFLLEGGSLRRLDETSAARAGWFHVQNLSSMVPPLVLDPQQGESILDMAAAPGSKTTQIACLLGGKGSVLANDRSRSRFYRLRAVVAGQGATNVTLCCRPGEWFGRARPDAFDRVLVDVPCSGEGRFDLDRPETWKDWSLPKVRRCARIQRRLLESAVRTVRSGGVIVYSTCSISPEENEEVVDDALGRFPDALELEKISVASGTTVPGLRSWRRCDFRESVRLAVRILPSREHEAFFVARLRKVGALGEDARRRSVSRGRAGRPAGVDPAR